MMRSAIKLMPALLLAILATACGTAGGGGGGPDNGDPVVTALIQATPTSGAAPLTVQFSGAGSSSNRGSIVAHAWDFGDGTSGAGVGTSHTFTAGTWTVRLTVTDSNNVSASRTVTITATGDQDPDPDPDPNPENPDPKTVTGAAMATYGLADNRSEVAEDATTLMVDAVMTASQLASGGQQLVATGTLTQSGDTFTYSATPNDRLLVNFTNGNKLDIQLTALDGDLDADSASSFLRKPHQLAFSIIRLVDGVTDNLTFQSVRSGGEFQSRLQGDLVYGGTRYTLDLGSQGTYREVVDVEIDWESDETVTGTITSEGYSANINETFFFRFFMVENAIMITDRSVNSSWSSGGSNYSYQGVRIRRHFFNDSPSSLGEEWIATGNLVENGTVIGTFGQVNNNQISIDTFLDIGTERVILHRDLLQ